MLDPAPQRNRNTDPPVLGIAFNHDCSLAVVVGGLFQIVNYDDVVDDKAADRGGYGRLVHGVCVCVSVCVMVVKYQYRCGGG